MFGTYRIILALMVVALHLGNATRIGNYAVFGFYTLSGYLMTLIMVRNYGYTTSGILKYLLNRFLRIYPVYWASIILSAAVIFLFGETVTTNFEASMYLPKNIPDLTRNIFVYFPTLSVSRLNSQAWSLTVEIFFIFSLGLEFQEINGLLLDGF